VAIAPTDRDTRERVLRAASELFAARGFAGTSISAIREASGVLPSSMYWEFGSKEGILSAVLEEASERWLEQASASARRALERPAATVEERLGDALDFLADALAERPEFLRLLLLLSLEHRDGNEASLEIVRRVRQRARDALARVFRNAGAPDAALSTAEVSDLTRASLAFFDGAFIAAQIDPDTTDLRGMFALLRGGFASPVRQSTRDGGDQQ